MSNNFTGSYEKKTMLRQNNAAF